MHCGRVLKEAARDSHKPVFKVYSVSCSFFSNILNRIGRASTLPLMHSEKNWNSGLFLFFWATPLDEKFLIRSLKLSR